jgi:hypothetical protein
MKHVAKIFLAALIVFSACSEEDPGSSEACIQAKKELQEALDDYVNKANQHPAPNAAPYVLEAHEAELKLLYNIREQKSEAVITACQ